MQVTESLSLEFFLKNHILKISQANKYFQCLVITTALMILKIKTT